MTLRRVVAIAVLLAVPMWVFAQTITQDGSRTDPGRRGTGQGMAVGGILRSDTTFKMLTFDSDGNLMTLEAAPAFDQNGIAQDIIVNTGLANGSADSSGMIDTHKWRVSGLLIKAVPSTGTSAAGAIAVQIRTHLGGVDDSSHTFAWYPISVDPRSGDADGIYPDTLNVGHITTGSASAVWSGEFTVTIARNRNAPANGVAAVAFQYPSGIYIPLSNFYGTDFWSPWTSVRVRVMRGNTTAITVHMIGTPL